MTHKILTASFLAAALSVFSVGAIAQHPKGNSPNQSDQTQSAPGMMGGGMMGHGGMGQGMMNGQGMYGMMGRMMAQHQQMSALMDQAMGTMGHMQSGMAPAAMRENLSALRSQMREMRGLMMRQGRMMHNLAGQIQNNCPATGQGQSQSSSPSQKPSR